MATRDKTVKVNIDGDASGLIRAAAAGRVALSRLHSEATQGLRGLHDEIDKTNDRTAWLAQGILALAPAVTTLGAGAVPVLSGLATHMTVGVAAAGTMALAFNGVGDALGALNDYQLEPTAENMEQLQVAMEKIGPAGAEFVRFLDSIGPKFSELSNTAREGMFPGMIEGIESFMDLMPQLNRVVGEIAGGIGELSASAGADLAGPEWADFFNYLETDARPILVEMGNTLGNFMQGMGDLLVAFGPLSADFSSGFESMSESFAEWAAGLEGSTGFHQFVEYVRDAAPLAKEFIGSLANAFVELLEAAAPVGEKALPLLSGFLDMIAELADTPLGPTVLAFTALTSAWGRLNALATITGSGVMARATKGIRENVSAARKGAPTFRELGTTLAFAAHSQNTLTTAMRSNSRAASTGAAQAMLARDRVREFGRSVAPVAGQVGLLAVAMSGVDDKMGLSNTTALTLAGSLAGPWGAAAGAAVGLTMDLAAANDNLEDAVKAADAALQSQSTDGLRAARNELRRVAEEADADWDDFFSWDIGRNNQFFRALVTDAEPARAKLSEVESALRNTGDAGDLLAGPLGMSARAFRNARTSAEEFTESLAAVNRMLEGRANMRDYEAALDDLTASFRENGKTLDISTEKGRANQAALDTIASTALRVAENMRGANRVRFLDNARDDFVDAAQKLGMTERAAERLATQLGLLDKDTTKPKVDADTREANRKLDETGRKADDLDRKRPKVRVDGDNRPARQKIDQAEDWILAWGREHESAEVDADNRPSREAIRVANLWLNGWGDRYGAATVDAITDAAQRKMEEVARILANLDGDVAYTEVVTRYRTVRSSSDALPPRGGGAGADGMTIPGPRYPYMDRDLYLLAPGEEVISNRHGQADRHRDLLKAINANRLADGGTVGALLAASASPSVSVSAPSLSLSGARFVLEVPGMGQVMTRVVRHELAADRRFSERLNDRD